MKARLAALDSIVSTLDSARQPQRDAGIDDSAAEHERMYSESTADRSASVAGVDLSSSVDIRAAFDYSEDERCYRSAGSATGVSDQYHWDDSSRLRRLSPSHRAPASIRRSRSADRRNPRASSARPGGQRRAQPYGRDLTGNAVSRWCIATGPLQKVRSAFLDRSLVVSLM